ncbi:MAG: site-specific integrase [Bacteroidales bacterium]|jgi:integrase|nr:site-specific integrase [Bacteroidales bacterium]
MQNEVTTAIILETRKPRKDNLYPVKLRVTYKRDRRYYTLKDEVGKTFALSESDFAKIMGERPRDPFKKIALYFSSEEQHARDVIKKIVPAFSFPAFEKKYFTDLEDDEDLFSGLDTAAKALREEGRISTAVAYECTKNSLEDFHVKKILPYSYVDIQFLNKYEKWMLANDKSSTTIGIYLRNVRALFNKAVKNGKISAEYYPFGEGKYVIPGGRNIKKALTQKEVGLIANYPAKEGRNEQKYRDLWLFSYLCNGMNVKDMAFLTYGKIKGDVITFIRSKTAREKKKDPRPITIIITPLIRNIIDRWGNKSEKPDNYIFPILEPGLTPEQQYARVQQTTKMINKYINEIAEELKLPNRITSYTARHSFATVLKRSGASMEFISESLGHSNLATTENYLADFEIAEKKKWAKKLANF